MNLGWFVIDGEIPEDYDFYIKFPNEKIYHFDEVYRFITNDLPKFGYFSINFDKKKNYHMSFNITSIFKQLEKKYGLNYNEQ